MGARFRTFVVVAELDSPAGHVTSLLTWLLSRAGLGNAVSAPEKNYTWSKLGDYLGRNGVTPKGA
ncbi:hypothetical protein MGG_16362 [Pyricularia oryzae 70-15]|uniref:Uncharacterized protein n=1 Tax=Pyricularia oryzae (strain 70-15 / ATCC MYA-4617 / FGSC 8958) TaxID=242507 RepID=G4MLS3_PYRO7|nr:uncharacterized protein MGG_16362 [Pyricularia oryzae 70-15]EHA57701.1 hypothetical protein MGG_16362 [Pyricularia oryzae 70-15]